MNLQSFGYAVVYDGYNGNTKMVLAGFCEDTGRTFYDDKGKLFPAHIETHNTLKDAVSWYRENFNKLTNVQSFWFHSGI